MPVPSLFAALVLPLLLALPAAAQDRPEEPPLEPDRLARGVAASAMMALPLVDGQGRSLGHIRDVLLQARDSHLAGVIALPPGDAPDGPRPVVIPWSAVRLGEGAVRVDVPEGAGLDAFALPADGVAPLPGQGRTLGNLIGDYAVLRGGVGFGTVRDVVFDPADGVLIAVVVEPAGRFGSGRAAAYPYDAAAWTPEAGVYALPYGEGEVADHPPFDLDGARGSD
ncbi:PRC-barrel domain-containing protein [Novispirillum sp. DQ9]|uniref:PRC-barrel domain-containing protein n=1 Tax=Novispirillum sp. DQ9 TaxID=3398612 RepID=UPI003C7C959E